MFLDSADLFLIAKARVVGYTIVTEEKSAPKSQRKICIPDVCKEFNVRSINTMELLRKVRAKF